MLPTVPEVTVIFTGVTELDKGRTLLFAALGLCLGAIDVSVGPTELVILIKKGWKKGYFNGVAFKESESYKQSSKMLPGFCQALLSSNITSSKRLWQ